jgi:hypothetical protein
MHPLRKRKAAALEVPAIDQRRADAADALGGELVRRICEGR